MDVNDWIQERIAEFAYVILIMGLALDSGYRGIKRTIERRRL